jgi:hypothetical protein
VPKYISEGSVEASVILSDEDKESTAKGVTKVTSVDEEVSVDDSTNVKSVLIVK